jgi:hypothetical protein
MLAQRSTLSGPSGSTAGSVSGATVQPLEAALLVNTFGISGDALWQTPTRTVWYAWTATAAGTLVLRTSRADDSAVGANAIIAVFDAAAVGVAGDVSKLVAVAASRAGGSGTGRTDDVSARVRAGGVYAIVVTDSGFLSEAAFRLSWAFGGELVVAFSVCSLHLRQRRAVCVCVASLLLACACMTAAVTATPANDAFAAAITLTGGSGSASPASGQFATIEAGEPTPDTESFNGVTRSTLWYKWTATATGLLQVTVPFNGDGNSGELGSTVGVYTGTTLANAAILRSAERCPGTDFYSLSRCVLAPVSRGTRYWIQVETRDTFQLSWAVAGTTLHRRSWCGCAPSTVYYAVWLWWQRIRPTTMSAGVQLCRV